MTKLNTLLHHCNEGAGNLRALIPALADAIVGMDTEELKKNVAVKYIMGHFMFLLGEAAGPSQSVYDEAQILIKDIDYKPLITVPNSVTETHETIL